MFTIRKTHILIILIAFRFLNAQEQNHISDSLFNNLKNARHDSTRFKVYMGLGDYFKKLNPDTALYYYSLAEKISDKIPGDEAELKKGEAIRMKGWCNYLKGNLTDASNLYEQSLKIAEKFIELKKHDIKNRALKLKSNTFSNIGVIKKNLGNYSLAMEYYQNALKIDEQIDNKHGMAVNLGNIGNIFNDQGNYHEALEYYFKALKINEEIKDKQNQSVNLSNIGNIYFDHGNYDLAFDYYSKALKINEEIGRKNGQASNMINIGNIFFNKNNYAQALDYYLKALKIFKEIGNKQNQAIIFSNVGKIYLKLGEYSRALEYYLKAKKIDEDINNKNGVAINLNYIGELYLYQKKYKESEIILKKAEQMHREMHTIYYLKDACSDLSKLYEQTGRYKEALYYYKEYIKARDSLLSEENRKSAIEKDMKYKYEKEQALREQEHQKQLAIEKEKQEKQKITTRFIITGLVLVLLFSGFIVNRLQVTRKQKKIIENQKQIVEEQKKVVEEQKLVVEQKNKDITDSIKYAKRIQDAILPHPQKWIQYLPNSFILYLPKDIVAGDFYWMEVLDNYIYIAAADCTGHGVPGAMVSVVCSNALTKAVLEEKITETDQILNRVREIVVEKLTSEENIRDGMDVCLIRLTKGTNTLQYSGANRPLYVVSPVAERVEATGNFLELKPDKQPIGRYEKSKVFTKQEIILQENSMLYLCTDGYADQFGGEKGKKIGSKAFKELLKENALIEHSEKQHEHLFSYFQNWKEKEEQMDDVTVVGIKIS